jgi:hypothetical protein
MQVCVLYAEKATELAGESERGDCCVLILLYTYMLLLYSLYYSYSERERAGGLLCPHTAIYICVRACLSKKHAAACSERTIESESEREGTVDVHACFFDR